MSKEKEIKQHGFFGKLIKIIMVLIFFAMGALLITLGSIFIAKNYDVTEAGKSYRWLSIVNIVMGCLLLTSPFFLNQKRGGLNKIIQIIFVIVFVVIGLWLIITCSLSLAKGWYAANERWFPIVNLVFGCLLLTSPFFLKRD